MNSACPVRREGELALSLPLSGFGVVLRRSRGSVDPTGFGVMQRRSRGSVDPTGIWGRATPVTRERDQERDPTGFGAVPRPVTRDRDRGREFPQLTSSGFGTVYRSMAEPKKGVARIPVPPRIQSKVEDSGHKEAGQTEQLPEVAASPGVHMLMSGVVDVKRDPLVVPLVGLLLAFSVISFIIQLLIAFS